MTSDVQMMAYAGSLSCGCIVAVTTDPAEHKVETAREVAKWIRQGMDITHRSVADIKADPAFLRECGGPEHKS